MRVLVACEFSGVVREAFRARGHDAWSCDIVPAVNHHRVQHIRADVLTVLDRGWDLLIGHPPCTYLASSGAGWMDHPKYPNRRRDQESAAEFFMALWNAPIEHIAIENPVGVMSTRFRKPDQVIQPWQFGHGETKATCLWLKNLPQLEPTKVVEPDYMRKPDGSYYTDAKGKRYSRIHFQSGRNANRSKIRSLTYPGIAAAMADQWGSPAPHPTDRSKPGGEGAR